MMMNEWEIEKERSQKYVCHSCEISKLETLLNWVSYQPSKLFWGKCVDQQLKN